MLLFTATESSLDAFDVRVRREMVVATRKGSEGSADVFSPTRCIMVVTPDTLLLTSSDFLRQSMTASKNYSTGPHLHYGWRRRVPAISGQTIIRPLR